MNVARTLAAPAELIKAGGVEKSLVMVITSGLVHRENFLHALDAQLALPLARAHEDSALALFRAQFDRVAFKKKLPIAFTFTPGKVVTRAGGKEVGAIASRALAEALLGVYVGADPVSKSAKASFAEGLARMVTA